MKRLIEWVSQHPLRSFAVKSEELNHGHIGVEAYVKVRMRQGHMQLEFFVSILDVIQCRHDRFDHKVEVAIRQMEQACQLGIEDAVEEGT